MTDEEMLRRLRRIRAAMGDVTELAPSAAPAMAFCDSQTHYFLQDWSGGRTQDHMDKDANSVVAELMGLRDRAKRWIQAKGAGKDDVDAFMKANLPVALMHDLGNMDKHGSLDRTPFSGRKPSLKTVRRVMLAQTQAREGSFVQVQYDWAGNPIVSGDGTAKLILTGDLVDERGGVIGKFDEVLADALEGWEQYLKGKGLQF